MQKIIASLLTAFLFLFAIAAHAQQEQIVTHYTIEVAVGEQYVWTPTQLAAIDNVSSSDESIATASLKKPRTITIQGKKAVVLPSLLLTTRLLKARQRTVAWSSLRSRIRKNATLKF